MTAYQLFRGLTGVDGELLAAVEPVDSRKEPTTKKLPARKIWLVAAVIALALLLAGCGIAYVLSLRQLELGTQTIPLPTDASQDGTAPTETEMQLTVFSLQGIEGTPNYQANQEWLAFTQSYTPSGGEYWDSDPAYWAYSVQDQTMVDKLDEICAKYGLKVIGKAWHEQVDCNKFLPLLGIDSLLKAGTDATLSIPAGRYFPGGSFTIYGTLNLETRRRCLPTNASKRTFSTTYLATRIRIPSPRETIPHRTAYPSCFWNRSRAA